MVATAPAVRKHPPRALRWRLAFLVLVSAVPILLFAVIMATLFERQHRAVIQANLRETAGRS